MVRAPKMGKDKLIIVNLSGRGDKDVAQVADEGEVGNAEVNQPPGRPGTVTTWQTRIRVLKHFSAHVRITGIELFQVQWVE